MAKLVNQLGEWVGLLIGGIIASISMLVVVIVSFLIISLPILIILLVLSPLWGPFAIVLYFIFKH